MVPAAAVGICLLTWWLASVNGQSIDIGDICVGKEDESYAVNPAFCDMFLVCRNGMPGGYGSCPTGMLFNSDNNICDFPSNVDCKEIPISDDFQATEFPAEVSRECPASGDVVYLPHPESCSTYTLCAQGNPIEMRCPLNLHWNRAKNECDIAAQAQCEESVPSSNGCPERGSTVIAHPDDCQKFIFCLEGVSRTQICQMLKIYDPVQEQCVPGNPLSHPLCNMSRS